MIDEPCEHVRRRPVADDWARHLKKIKVMHRGLAVALPPEVHSFVHDHFQTRSRQAQAIADHVSRNGTGMHWSTDLKTSHEFAKGTWNRERKLAPGQTSVILHAAPPRPEHIETDPDELARRGISSYSGSTLGTEREIPLKEGAPVNITGVTWYGYRNKKYQGDVYDSGSHTAALATGRTIHARVGRAETMHATEGGYAGHSSPDDLFEFTMSNAVNPHFWKHHAAPQQVSLKQPIYATQRDLVRKHVERYLADPESPRAESTGSEHPMLVKHQGRVHVLEGHHRVSAELLRGSDSIHAHYYDADRRGFPPGMDGNEEYRNSPWGRVGARQTWYHGTHAEFERFDQPQHSQHWNNLVGPHFAADEGLAGGFGHGGRVLHTQLDMTNPKHYESEHDMDREAYGHEFEAGNHPPGREHDGDLREQDHANPWRFMGWLHGHPDKQGIAHRFRERLKAAGHDGIVYGNALEGSDGSDRRCAIAFHPDQVKITQSHPYDETRSEPEHAEHDPSNPYQCRTAAFVPDKRTFNIEHVPMRDAGKIYADHDGREVGSLGYEHTPDGVRYHPIIAKPDVRDALVEELHRHHPDAQPHEPFAGRQQHVAWVRTEHLKPYRSDDRAAQAQEGSGYETQRGVKHSLDRLADSLGSGEPIHNPLELAYDPGQGRALLDEGNHRLAAAEAAGHTHVPVIGYISRRRRNKYSPSGWSSSQADGGAPAKRQSIPHEQHDWINPDEFLPKGVERIRHTDGFDGRTAAFVPDKRIFGPTHGLDHRLWEGDHLKHDVSNWILGTLGGFWAPVYGPSWPGWARVYFAGSEASEWTSAALEGNGDFDVLVGVDYDQARAAVPGFAGLSDQEITAELNAEFREHLIPRTDPSIIMVDGEETGPWSVTWYVNPDSWDIRTIKPYAAYNVSADTWAVRPPHLPDWSIQDFPPALVAEATAVEAYVRSVLDLPEPMRSQQADALWRHLHGDRSRAFSAQGEGWADPGNALEKWLDQAGLWEPLAEAHFAAVADPTKLLAPADWSNDPRTWMAPRG